MTKDMGKQKKIDSRTQKRLREEALGIIMTRPKNCQGIAVKAFNGDASPRGAIKAMCQQCMGYEDIIKSIRDCKSMICPLWQYRPYQEKDSDGETDS